MLHYYRLLMSVAQFFQQVLDHVALAHEALHEQVLLLETQNQALIFAKQPYKTLFELAPDGYLVTDATGTILYANRAIAIQLNANQDYLIGRPLASLVTRRSRDMLYAKLNQVNGAPPQSQFEPHRWDFLLYPTRGNPFHASIALTVSHEPLYKDTTACLLWLIRDVTAQKQLEQKIQYMAFHDELTELPNRKQFNQHLSEHGSRLEHGTGDAIAVALLDVDRFKQINDTYGHNAGDGLLQAIAARVSHCLRAEDTLYRWAGDEFALILDTTAGNLTPLFDRILAQLRQPFRINNCTIHTTASIGITYYRSGDDSDAVLSRSDIALYQAKRQSRDTYRFYQAIAADAIQGLARLEQELRRLLVEPTNACQELALYFQPQIDYRRSKIVTLEALVRWRHPRLGLLYPNTFIELAETSNLILPLGEWVLREAIAQAAQWQAQGFEPQLAVNISSRQFQHQNLVGLLQNILDTTGYNPQQLELEITETMAIDPLKTSRCSLTDLAKTGVSIALDDFGVGYSSFARLKHLPVNTLKIDRSLVTDLGQHTADAAIVATIVALAKGLNLSVVAEGVETKQQVNALASLGCYKMQGHWFSPAIPANQVLPLLRSYDDATALKL